jgi:hypothetical protein
VDIARALEGDRPDLVVDSAVNRKLHRSDKGASGCFETVTIRGFTDLQALGFAPAQLTEDRVRQAIFHDELEALRSAPQPCGCGGDHPVGESAPTLAGPTRADTRPRWHPHLARLFEEQAGVRQAPDALPLRVLAGAMATIALGELVMQLVLVRDIVVHTNATLTIPSGVSLLRVRDVKLYVGAKLILPPPYVKVVGRSIKGDLV